LYVSVFINLIELNRSRVEPRGFEVADQTANGIREIAVVLIQAIDKAVAGFIGVGNIVVIF